MQGSSEHAWLDFYNLLYGSEIQQSLVVASNEEQTCAETHTHMHVHAQEHSARSHPALAIAAMSDRWPPRQGHRHNPAQRRREARREGPYAGQHQLQELQDEQEQQMLQRQAAQQQQLQEHMVAQVQEFMRELLRQQRELDLAHYQERLQMQELTHRLELDNVREENRQLRESQDRLFAEMAQLNREGPSEPSGSSGASRPGP